MSVVHLRVLDPSRNMSTTNTAREQMHRKVKPMVENGKENTKENTKDGLTADDKVSSAQMIGYLQRDLERAHAKILRRDETIAKLKKLQSKQESSADPELEEKLQDLIQKYETTENRHRHELDVFRSSQQESSKENRTLRRELENANARLEASVKEVEDMKAEVRVSKERESDGLHGRRIDWLKEKHELENKVFELKRDAATGAVEMKAMKREVEKLGAVDTKLTEEFSQAKTAWSEERCGLAEKVDTLENQVEEMEDQAERMAEAFARMRLDSVRWDVYAKVRDDALSERHSRMAWEGRARLAEGCRVFYEEEVDCLQKEMRVIKDQRDMLSEALGDLLQERKQYQNLHLPRDDTSTYESPFDRGSDIVVRQLLNVTMTHYGMSTAYYQSTLHSLQTSHCALLQSYETLETTHQALVATHDADANELRAVRNELREAEEAHKLCADQKLELRMYAEDAKQERDMADGRTSSLQEDIRRLGMTMQMDRDALKRANEGTKRWKAAEGALLEDIARLEHNLEEARRFEELYNELVEEHWIVVSREAAASEEVERVGHQNAELVGHVNGDQKINYVETLRRDMALMRAELASTRMRLNVANDRVRELDGEVAAYKAIDEGLGASTRTRVLRRQPEGGMLSSTSTRGRNVSGPSGRFGK